MKKIKTLCLIVMGNILEYYDFLLFAHIGYLIVPMFIPEQYAEQSHLFALMLYALPFIIRPLGGYFFGKMADQFSIHKALNATLGYASLGSMIIAILPNYYDIGVFATIFFVIFSYYLRKHNFSKLQKACVSRANSADKIERSAIYRTLSLGAVTSVSCYIPMVYSNFYFTKILHMNSDIGFIATLISLITYVIFIPLMGFICDCIDLNKHISKTFVVAIPIAIIGFLFVWQGYLFGQIPLTIAASIAGANIHVIMNQIGKRSRSVNLYFGLGSALGGLVPALSGYLSTYHNFSYTPILAINALLIMNAYLFMRFEKSSFVFEKQNSEDYDCFERTVNF